MSLDAFLARVRAGEPVTFAETIEMIGAHYRYTPVGFRNGELYSAAGTNEGSCKIFFFARLHGLNVDQTLALFGDFYRKDVLQNPAGTDHGNIRNFMKTGWKGIAYDGEALVVRGP